MAQINDPSISDRYDFMKPLWNPADGGAIAYAKQVIDQNTGENQSAINAEVQASIEDVEDLLAAAL